MRPTIPSLAALRAFEAVARLGSFTRAAQELGITQGAVSYQVRLLEEEIRSPLFRREGRGIALTVEAQRLLPILQRALGDIAEAIAAVRPAAEDEARLTVALSTYFAAHWLSKRLAGFSQRHPAIKLRLQHPESTADFAEIDMAIRWHALDTAEPGLQSERLFAAPLAPVCSPRLRGGPLPLASPADLQRHTLLRDEVTREAWNTWLKRAGVAPPERIREVTINDPNVYIQAAIDGQGFALADSLVADDIALGRLIEPFDMKLDGYGYFLTYPRTALARRSARAFRDWLLAEVESSGGSPRGTAGR
jgi:LysR family glycine cleavage system transcriptional activator